MQGLALIYFLTGQLAGRRMCQLKNVCVGVWPDNAADSVFVIDRQTISKNNFPRDLGITMDRHLTFSLHIAKIVVKTENTLLLFGHLIGLLILEL